jgi:hypothetical protein
MSRKKRKTRAPLIEANRFDVCKCNLSKEKERFSSLFKKLATVVILSPDFFNSYWDLVEKMMNLF